METTGQFPYRSFAAPRWHGLAGCALGAVLLALELFYGHFSGLGVLGAAIVPVLLLAFGADVYYSRVDLVADELRVRRAYGKRSYPRSTITEARSDAPAIVSVNVAGIGWIRLPYMGAEANALLPSLRHWITQGGIRLP
jgi:hypothetical protein